MSDKSDDSPPRLTGSSKSYNLDGDTAEFDPGALQVHEFSPEMRQQISATKLPRFKPRTPKLEPVPAARKRLSQRFLRVVGVAETAPIETEQSAEEYVVAPLAPADDAAQDAPTIPSRGDAAPNKTTAASARTAWQWGLLLFGLCLGIGVLCFWLTRPPSADLAATTTPAVHAAKNDSPTTPSDTSEPATQHPTVQTPPRHVALEEPSDRAAAPASPSPQNSTLHRTREPKPSAVGHVALSNGPPSKKPPEPKTETPAQSTSNAEPQSVFDTAIRPPAVRTRRN